MKKIIASLFLVAVVVPSFAAFKLIPFGDVDGIVLKGAMKVNITVGASKTGAIVTGASSAVDKVSGGALGQLLIIQGDQQAKSPEAVVTISVKSLKGLEVAGNNLIKVTGINADTLNLQLHGNNTAAFYGTAKQVTLQCYGQTDVDARLLRAQKITVQLFGAGKVLAYSDQGFIAQAFGGTIVTYGPGMVMKGNAFGGKVIQGSDSANPAQPKVNLHFNF